MVGPHHHNNNIDYVTPPQGLKTEDDHNSLDKSMWPLARVHLPSSATSKECDDDKDPSDDEKSVDHRGVNV